MRSDRTTWRTWLRRLPLRLALALLVVGCAPLPVAEELPRSPVLRVAIDLEQGTLRLRDPQGRQGVLALIDEPIPIQIDAPAALLWPSFLETDLPRATPVDVTDTGRPGRLATASLDSPGRWW
jgi:hypothetical protein